MSETTNTETGTETADPVQVLVMHLGNQLAKDLLAIGDEPGSPAHRVQFKGGKYPDDEKDQGGMCEVALAGFFAEKLKEYLSA